jgi:hypothetical protein
MPAPFLIGDERAFADFLTNLASQPVTIQTLTVSGNLTVTGTTTSSGAEVFTASAVGIVPVTITGFSAAQTGDLLDVFQTGTTSLFKIATAASAVNGMTYTATATGANVNLTFTGDANRGLTITNAGTGTSIVAAGAVTGVPLTLNGFSTAQTGNLLNVLQNSAGNAVFTVGTATTAANGVTVAGVAASSNPTISATGTDANISLALAGKGTGSVSVGPGGGLAGLTSSSVAASSAINTVETVLQTFPLIAGATLKVGSHIRITAQGTSTATAANVVTFTLRAGTLGTTGDASVAAFVTAASGTTGTAIPFSVTIDFVVRTLGASGTGAGSMVLVANAATAIGGAVTNVNAQTTATLATTTATFLTFTHVSAASTTTETFQNVSIDVLS